MIEIAVEIIHWAAVATVVWAFILWQVRRYRDEVASLSPAEAIETTHWGVNEREVPLISVTLRKPIPWSEFVPLARQMAMADGMPELGRTEVRFWLSGQDRVGEDPTAHVSFFGGVVMELYYGPSMVPELLVPPEWKGKTQWLK